LLPAVERAWQRQLETHGLAGRRTHEYAYPPLLRHESAQKRLGKIGAHLIHVVCLPGLLEQRQERRDVKVRHGGTDKAQETMVCTERT
jgi:hypothetical protein